MTVQDATAKVTDGDQLDDGYFNGVSGVRAVEAGETVTAGEVGFIYGSGHANVGEAWLSDANVQDKNRANGIFVTSGNDGDTVYLMTRGIYITTGLTAKETYYLSATAGAITTTPSGVKIGQAISTTELFVDIVQDDRDTVGTIKPWLQDHAGMIANPLTAFWKLCDGTVINDAESPLNNGGAGEAPLANATQRFLRGASTSDDGTDNTAGGADTHTHSITQENKGYRNNIDANRTNYSPTITGSGSTLPAHIDAVMILKIK